MFAAWIEQRVVCVMRICEVELIYIILTSVATFVNWLKTRRGA